MPYFAQRKAADFRICGQNFIISRNDRALDNKISGGGILVAVPNLCNTSTVDLFILLTKFEVRSWR